MRPSGIQGLTTHTEPWIAGVTSALAQPWHSWAGHRGGQGDINAPELQREPLPVISVRDTREKPRVTQQSAAVPGRDGWTRRRQHLHSRLGHL